MASNNATMVTVIGNLTADPELRFTPSGVPVANFTIASTPREFDREKNEWKDGQALFIDCSVWRKMAENVAETLAKGTKVVAYGQLKARTYENREGEKRTVWELHVENVGPDLGWATAKVTRQRSDSQGNSVSREGGANGSADSSSAGPKQAPAAPAAPPAAGDDDF